MCSRYENRDRFNQNAWTIHFVAFALKIFIITNFYLVGSNKWTWGLLSMETSHFFLIDSYIWFPSNNFFLCFRCGRWYFVCLVHLVLSALSKPPMCYEIKPLSDPSVLIFLQLYSIIQLTFFFNNRFRTFWQKWNWTKICKGMPFNYLKSGFYLIFPKVKDRVEIEVAGNYYLRFNLTTLCVFVSGSSNKTWSVIIY